MAAVELDDSSFAETLARTGTAVVDFHAGWCGPCLMFKPKFKRLSEAYPQASFFLVDGEKAPVARASVQISDLPFFAVYKDGKFVEGLSTADEGQFKAFVERHL